MGRLTVELCGKLHINILQSFAKLKGKDTREIKHMPSNVTPRSP